MPVNSKLFPPDFVWGVATSAYQIEGGAAADGRAPSIWDTFCRQAGAIADGTSGDVACDHYHRLDEDLDLLQRLRVPAYRYSISWSRVQPKGQGAWNEAGLAFYDRLIDGLLERGIAPYLTLYHWDLPQALQDRGGWHNADTVHRFVDYAVAMARRYGDRVQSIATLNEPWVVATLGHEQGIFAPGIKDRRVATQVSHHLLLAHGRSLQAIRESACTAPLGLVLNQAPIAPATPSEADRIKAMLADGYLVRWYMDALFRGEYPRDVIEDLGADAPVIGADDMQAISTPLDFLGLNYYTRNFVGEADVKPAAGAEHTDMGWEVYPQGLTQLLTRLQREYDIPPLYVMENGAAYADSHCNQGHVHDDDRVAYLQRHVAAVGDALDAGVDVRGYFVWSLFDNFEWAFGLSKRFGLVHVDYQTLQRTPKDSALWYRDFIAQQKLRQPGLR